MTATDTIKAFAEEQYPINPPLPTNFDDTPNDERPEWQNALWHRPYIQIIEFSGSPEYKKQWLESWPEGKRFDIRCLDGGTWDRSTVWGIFKTPEEAVECCKAGPVWRH